MIGNPRVTFTAVPKPAYLSTGSPWSRIGGMWLLFGYRGGVGVKEVSHAGITTDQQELADGVAGTTSFKQPEEALDGDIYNCFRCLLAGR